MSQNRKTQLDLDVQAEGWHTVSDLEALCFEAHAIACKAVLGLGVETETSLVLASDETVQSLNADYRGMDKPTNVLSFAQAEPPFEAIEPGLPVMLGDLVLAWQTCALEANQLSKPVASHLQHLIVHGTLHLFAYDHETDEDAAAMEALETELMSQLGWPDPYEDTNQ